MSLDRRSAETPPVRGVGDLIGWFRARERPPSEWKVGLEHEKVPVIAGTTRPVPYGGPRGIAAFLRGFCRYGYEPFEDAGNIIAAQRQGLTVSIEPGGQVELSGRPFQDVHVVADEVDRHHAKCAELGASLGIALLATGYRPWGTPATAEWMPKTRYEVMRPFLAVRGRYAEDMMAMTGSTQASFDFGSEQDVAEKLRTALAAQPVCAALWANSPIVNGRESGWLSYRVQVWESVDPARQGMLPFAFDPGFAADPYRHYVEWALDVPMIFFRRDGAYRETGGRTFRAFMADGIEGERATLLDWEDHLSTVFTDVRVKGVVEVRAADACDAGMTKALAAFWKGLLYDRTARTAAFDVLRDLTLDERHGLMIAAGRDGLRGRAPDGRTLAALARELIEIAAAGLCRQNCCGNRGEDERVWLEPLAARAETSRSPADEALEAFRRGGDAALLEQLRIA
jgi:glutamate--cysteine ligase